jgi:4-amino-4-deoxy-L-arabinose transferase-like glycosyltransferase
VKLRPQARAVLLAGLALAAFVVVIRLAVRGTLPSLGVAILAPALLLASVALAAHGVGHDVRQRPAYWLFALGTLIALPTLGASGLIDPWETHYAEVAREMLERHDFVSPWWANEGWFMTKPVLLFWLEAVSMKIFGAASGPDQVLTGAHTIAHPEWAVRLPGFGLALVGAHFLSWGIARTCGRRAGFLGGVVLWTMPGFALLSHQAITDMPLIAGIAASIGLVLGALSTSDAALSARVTLPIRPRSIELHAGHAVALVIGLAAVAQLTLLLVGRVHLGPDHLLAGSPHACTLPSQPPCTSHAVAIPRLTPVLQALFWAIPTTWLVVRAAEETRIARLMMLGAWGFAALAAMAKGPAGLVVPALAGLGHVIARRDLRELRRMEIPAGLVLAIVFIGPWYLAIYARHGRGFIDELVLRNMLGRTLDHLHDTNEGEDVGIVYFVRQLAYATFPWSGLALGSVLTLSRSAHAEDRSRRGIARVVLFVATMGAFALVSTMRTKFHHYVLITLPPLAMLVGIELDAWIAIAQRARESARESWARGTMIVAAAVVLLVGRDLATEKGPASFVLLLTYRYSRAWPSTHAYGLVFAALAAAATLTVVAMAASRARRNATFALAGVAVLLSVVLLDSYMQRCGSDGGQRDVLATYYADRPPKDRAPLVAYQLNWKGENFYSGNNLAIFITSGARMKTYLDTRRASDERTVYFVTERGRVRTLQDELGAVQSFRELTSATVSHEFSLVRVVL